MMPVPEVCYVFLLFGVVQPFIHWSDVFPKIFERNINAIPLFGAYQSFKNH